MSIGRRALTILGFVALTALVIPASADATPGGGNVGGDENTVVGLPTIGNEMDPVTDQPGIHFSCDKGMVDPADLLSALNDTIKLEGHEAWLVEGPQGFQVLNPATIEWYDTTGCKTARLVGELIVTDIGPTCVRVRVVSVRSDGSEAGSRVEEVCQDIQYGTSSLPLDLVSVGDADLDSVKVYLEIEDHEGAWHVLDEKGRAFNDVPA